MAGLGTGRLYGRPGTARTRVGLRAVAERAGVSTATVSNTLNRPELVSPAAQSRVVKAIDELGYVPNIAARNLRTGTSASLGVVFFDLANPFFAMIARHMSNEANAQGYSLIVMSSDQDEAREQSGLDFLIGHGVRGIAVTTAQESLDSLLGLRRRGIAALLLAQESESDDLGSISVDDELGMVLLTKHLVETGRRRIGLINGPGSARQHLRRRAGIIRALVESGLNPAAYLVEVTATAPDSNGGHGATRDLLQRGDGNLDAIMAINDYTAFGAVSALAEAGLRVPEDIAVTGFDDVETAALLAVPLTTIRQPLAKLGQMAARALIDAVEHDGELTRIVLPPELVVRRSTQQSAKSNGVQA